MNGSKPYIFPNPKTGLPLKHFFSIWDRIRSRAGLPDLRIHDLRHNFASLLINSGRSVVRYSEDGRLRPDNNWWRTPSDP